MSSLTLALDCSTSLGSVAVGASDRCIWQTEFPTGRGCGGKLFAALQEATALVEEMGESLAGIVVGLGPGSYSGVRQAIAAAMGLAAATGAALRGVPSVTALPVWAGPHHVVGDARRGTFYYTAVRGGVCLAGPELLADAALLADRLTAEPDWPVYAVESALPEGVAPGAIVCLPLAERLLVAASSAHQAPPLEPIYLRPVSITLPKPRPLSVP